MQDTVSLSREIKTEGRFKLIRLWISALAAVESRRRTFKPIDTPPRTGIVVVAPRVSDVRDVRDVRARPQETYRGLIPRIIWGAHDRAKSHESV